MRRIGLSAAASIAEIVASIAVVISIVFVVYSLNQNTAALQATNDNFLYQMRDSHYASLSEDEDLAAISMKVYAGEELSEIEEYRAIMFFHRAMGAWELAFTRHSEGHMPPKQWKAWNHSFSIDLLPVLTPEFWAESKEGYGEEFIEHIDAYVLEKAGALADEP